MADSPAQVLGQGVGWAVVVGLGFAFALTKLDAFGIASLITHSVEPMMTVTIFVSVMTLSFAVGATLTGFVFTMMEER